MACVVYHRNVDFDEKHANCTLMPRRGVIAKKVIKIPFYNSFIWVCSENLNNTFTVAYMLNISPKSVDTEKSDRHRKM